MTTDTTSLQKRIFQQSLRSKILKNTFENEDHVEHAIHRAEHSENRTICNIHIVPDDEHSQNRREDHHNAAPRIAKVNSKAATDDHADQ